MEPESIEPSEAVDEPMIDRAFIVGDIGITHRTLYTYQKDGRFPLPDANLLGRDLWRLSTYRKFKADLLAGKFAMVKRPPHLRGKAVAQ